MRKTTQERKEFLTGWFPRTSKMQALRETYGADTDKGQQGPNLGQVATTGTHLSVYEPTISDG